MKKSLSARMIWWLPAWLHKRIEEKAEKISVRHTYEHKTFMAWMTAEQWDFERKNVAQRLTNPKLLSLYVKPDYSEYWKQPTWHHYPRVVRLFRPSWYEDKPGSAIGLRYILDDYTGEEVGHIRVEREKNSFYYTVRVGKEKYGFNPGHYAGYYPRPHDERDATKDGLMYLLAHHFQMVVEGKYTVLEKSERR